MCKCRIRCSCKVIKMRYLYWFFFSFLPFLSHKFCFFSFVLFQIDRPITRPRLCVLRLFYCRLMKPLQSKFGYYLLYVPLNLPLFIFPKKAQWSMLEQTRIDLDTFLTDPSFFVCFTTSTYWNMLSLIRLHQHLSEIFFDDAAIYRISKLPWGHQSHIVFSAALRATKLCKISNSSPITRMFVCPQKMFHACKLIRNVTTWSCHPQYSQQSQCVRFKWISCQWLGARHPLWDSFRKIHWERPQTDSAVNMAASEGARSGWSESRRP